MSIVPYVTCCLLMSTTPESSPCACLPVIQRNEWTLVLEGLGRVHVGRVRQPQQQPGGSSEVSDGDSLVRVGVVAAESTGSRGHEAAWDKQVP